LTTCIETHRSGDQRVWQVAIVGGGPAGCAAAHEAARLELSGIVIERGERHRDKACGDMLVPGATAILRELGIRFEDHSAVPAGSAFGAVELRGRRGLLWRITYPDDAVWIVRRRILDQLLRDTLPDDMDVLYSASVSGIRQVRSGVLELAVRGADRRTMHILSESVIIAAGAQDPIARALGICGRGCITPSISTYLEEGGVDVPMFEFPRGATPGYQWVFPLGGRTANVGICSLVRTNGATLKSLGNELLARYGIAPDAVRWRGGAGSLWSGGAAAWHHDAGVVSCGDAAGLVDPVNGEGITAALMSGRAAAGAVRNFLESGWRPGALDSYSAWVGATFAAKYKRTPVRTVWRQLCGINRGEDASP
jgi:menaquinone-9 beta-reductase